MDRQEIEQRLRQLRPEPQPLSKDERQALRNQLFTQLEDRETRQMKRLLYSIPSAVGVGALLLGIALLGLLLTNNRFGIEGSVQIQTGATEAAATATPLPLVAEPTSRPPAAMADRTLSVVGASPSIEVPVVIDAQTRFTVTVAYRLESLEAADLQVKLTDGIRGVGGANLTIARGSGEVTVIIQPDYQELGNAERLGLWLTLLDPATGQPIVIDYPQGYSWTVAR